MAECSKTTNLVKNNRQLFRDIYDFKCKDRFCLYEQGMWPETYDRWFSEGLPKDLPKSVLYGVDNAIVKEEVDVYSYLNILWPCYLPINYHPIPSQAAVISEKDDIRIESDAWGAKRRTKISDVSLPQYFDWPVKNIEDWEKFNELFSGPIEQRLPQNWPKLAERIRQQDHGIVMVHCIGLFAFPREVMGLENTLIAFYDAPELIEKMLDDRLEFYFKLYEKPVKDTSPDAAFIWEDMSYIHGSFISPEFCRKFLLPRYKKLCNYFKDIGIKRIIVDSDGNVNELVPIWRESGINGILPLEVKAGNNVEELVKKWPDMVFIGGIDKHEIAKGKPAIDSELRRRLPKVIGRGGYIPSLDHWIPPDISLENYCYYRDKVLSFKAA